MKYLKLKFLLMFFALAMAIPPAWAGEETVTFSEQGYANQTDMTQTGYTGTNFSLSFAQGGGSNGPKYYTSGAAIRMYPKNSMTVTSSKTITKIVITFGSSDATNAITTDVATYENGTWTGSSKSVVFTVGGTRDHRRFSAVTVTYEENTPTPTGPWVTVNPSSLTINDVVGEENKFDVSARNIRDWQNLGVTPNNGFSVSGTSTPSTWYNDNGNTGFYSNSEHSADGTVTVTYEGRELIATGNVNCGTDGAEPKNVAVSYRSDVYIITNHGTSTWDYNGTLMTYDPDEKVYTGTVTVPAGACIMFSRKTGETYDWNEYGNGENRLFFGAQMNNGQDWPYGDNTAGSLGMNPSITGKYCPIKFKEAGTYAITINAEAKTFSITSSNVANIAEAQEFDGTFNFTGTAVVTYQKGNNLWILDDSGSGLIYGNVGITFANGNTLKPGWKANNSEYNGNPQFSNPTDVDKNSDGQTVAPEALNNLPSTTDANKYVSMSKVTVTRVDDKNYYIKINDNEFCLRDHFNNLETALVKDHVYNVIGVVNNYNGTPQLYLISAEEVAKVETPTFTPAAGTYYEAQSVAIACETEEAIIRYTTDGSDPTENSTVYAAPIAVGMGETMTIKAIATKEGMLNSTIAEATYTVLDPSALTTYRKVTSTDDLTNGNYLIVSEGTNNGTPFQVAFNGSLQSLDVANNRFEVTIVDNEIKTDVNGYFTINNVTEDNESYYTIKSQSGKYIGQTSDANGLKAQDDALQNAISFDGGNAVIVSGGAYMRYNSSSNNERFRYFKSSTYTQQKAIQLYKEVKATPDPVAAPTFNPEAGTYTTIQNVEISCATEGAAISYKIGENGEWKTYTEPIEVAESCTITAKATKTGMLESDEASATYTINLPTLEAPTFEPEAGTYDVAQNVAISAAEGAAISYKIGENGEWATYSKSIEVAESCTIYAKASKKGYIDSEVNSAAYVIRKEATLSFGETTAFTVYPNDTKFTAPTLTTDPEGLTPIKYTSSDEDVAAFVEGELIIGSKLATTTITAAFEGNDDYKPASATYTITVEPKPYLVADETVDMGTEKTKEFDVVGENLKGVVTLTCNNENFVVTPTEITPTEGAVEQTVTVTYNGSSYTDETATITVASQDAKSVIVTVKAHIAKPALIAVDDELEFEALVGKTDSKTFIVTGENLKDDVTLTLDDVNGVYSIEPTSITKADAEAGATVTVTYTPKAENTDDAKITVASTDADPVTVTLTGMATLPNPVIVVDDEPINMGTNPTGTFDLMATDLRGNITLTCDNENFTVSPTNITPEEAEEGVEVTVTYTGNNTVVETAHITIKTEGAEDVVITVTAKAETYVDIAKPTFSPAAGTYTEPKEVAIACATPGVTIEYKIGDGEYQPYLKPFTVGNENGNSTVIVTAKASKGSKVVYNDSEATATYEIKALPAAQIDNKYYYLVNNALPEMYANVAGRRTLNFVDNPADKAGTVFRVMTDPDTIGQVETLRSQGVDMQGYAKRAMNYVTPIVQMVVNKLNDMDGVDDATGTGSILGENGLGKILAEFNKSFDYHLYVEGNAGAYRIYARTPSMQRVVDFYNNPDNKSQIQEKLPMLEGYINQVLDKIRAKVVSAGMNGSVIEPFSLVKVWEKMGGQLIKPEGDNVMAFYDQVLTNKEYVWDFAYQTAMIYFNNIKQTETYGSMIPAEYQAYIEKMQRIRPETKYYMIQYGNEPDYVSENNVKIIGNDPSTYWTLTPRENFTVNVPEANKLNDSYYTTLYTDFAYTLPEGVTAYAVTDIDDNDVAQLAELSSPIAAQTPVLLKANAATVNVTLTTAAGNTPETNLLEGPDYLINKYKITSPTVEALFAIAAGIVGGEESDAYQTYVKPYEYLKLRTSGTVNNRYFWGLNSDDLKKCSEKNSEDKLDCVVRSLGLDENDKNIGFYRNREALLANQAFIPTIEFNPILLEVVATPTFDPEPGSYTEAQTVTIACETEGATIYYKMGDEENWTKYDPEQPINVAQTTTIQAYAVKDGLGDSEIAEATYTIELPAEAPTFNPVPGSYEEAQDVTIIAPEGATVSYRIDGGEWQTYTEGEEIHVDATQTIEAKVVMEGMSESAVATGYYVIDIPEALPTNMPVFDGYYSILNSGKYANIQGRKTLTFTTEPDAQAGTVIRLKSDNTGKVEVLRSQAADLQRYAYRALDYVPDIVQIVVDKLGAEGEGHILGQEGLDAIMDKFDKSFKPDLYIEKAGENGYRIYGKTPSMQPVVDFYRENKDKVEAKLPDLVAFINSALAKLRAKAEQAGMNGDNVFVDFDLKTIWERMGGNLTDPEVDEMGFYRDVLNYKDNVWNFAYQTATFYLEKIKNTSTYESLLDELGEYAQYLDKIDQIHPDFKYYIVANEGVTKPDFISEGNTDIANDAARTIWTIEPRENFTVNFPEENKLGDEYVTTLYTDFAYTLPEGVTAWAVENVNEQGIAKLAKVDDTTIAAQTPVLLKSTTAGDVATFGITTAEGTVPATNELVGPDYLIETYQIKTPEVVKLFEAIKSVLGENIYNDLVEDYGHLQLRNSGTVNNKYFWGLNEEEVKSCAKTNPETGKLVKVVRSLGIKDDILGFNDNEHVYTNKALLVSTEHSAITFSLRGDINRDGQITIADVPALIDILLELPAEPYHEPSELYPNYPKGLDYEAADFNENGDITIHDVSALIDYLLGV